MDSYTSLVVPTRDFCTGQIKDLTCKNFDAPVCTGLLRVTRSRAPRKGHENHCEAVCFAVRAKRPICVAHGDSFPVKRHRHGFSVVTRKNLRPRRKPRQGPPSRGSDGKTDGKPCVFHRARSAYHAIFASISLVTSASIFSPARNFSSSSHTC